MSAVEDGLRISGGGLSARIAPMGATVRDLRWERDGRPLLMAFKEASWHQDGPTYANTIVGRVANRLAGGRAVVDGRPIELERNVGSYHLHGGRVGFSHRRWDVVEHQESVLVLGLHSADGDQGYPGALDVTATFSLREGGRFKLTIKATCRAPTIVNLTHHLYFNLGGCPDICDHRLWLAPRQYLEANDEFVPTGLVRDVEDGVLDFRTLRPVVSGIGLRNHTFVLDRSSADPPRHAATLEGPDGIQMELWTNQPALHVYDGYRIPDGDELTSGQLSRAYSGICLEPQGWTDAPNHAGFPSIDLQREQEYCWSTCYKFRVA